MHIHGLTDFGKIWEKSFAIFGNHSNVRFIGGTFTGIPEVKNWHFPPIDPESTASEIEKLAEDYFQKLAVRIASIPDVAIHLMGEMTFSFALLKKLQESKIDCYASTANRNVNILASGEKVVRFDFVKFRKYG